MRPPPSLPERDPHPSRRARALSDARDDYQFDFSYQEIVAAKSVPLRDKDDPRYWLALAKVTAELKRNELTIRAPEKVHEVEAEALEGLAKLAPSAIAERLRALRPEPVSTTDARTPETYDRMFATIPRPLIASRWDDDAVFAWQALAGCNPIVIRRLERAMAHFAVTEADWSRAGAPGTMEAAIAEGRAYVADYAALASTVPGTYEGLAKHVFAPIALYASTPSGLRPVAIQCGQAPGPIFTPADGASWKMARTVVTSAEGNFQGVISHFALCHEVMESVILSTYRQLADNHPIHVLLSPHFANTLITNDIAMTSLIGPNGNMERLQSGTLETSLDVAKRAIADFHLSASAPHEDFAARGVDDTDALPDYPFRDDGALSWAPIERWVRDYLALYYEDDAAVAGDVEVAAWVDELGSQEGGRLNGLARPETVDALVGLVARIMYRCTVYHAAFNYTSYDLFAYAPAVQTAAFGPGPTGDGDDEAAWHAMWPPYQAAYEAMHLFYTITVQINRLGEYPARHFTDERVAPLLETLQQELAGVEQTIQARQADRLVPYPYLEPSRVSLSIHV